MSLPSTIIRISDNENNNNENNNENNIFSNNETNENENNENENNENENNENENNENQNENSTITKESNIEYKNSNNNLPFPMNFKKNYRRKSRRMNPMYHKTRKAQRGGSKIPGVSNVVRITGKTLKKIGNVGIYGLKKVGNGVHVITHVVNKGVTAITGRNNFHRGKTAKKGLKGLKGPLGKQH
jgi:hypothetical protein